MNLAEVPRIFLFLIFVMIYFLFSLIMKKHFNIPIVRFNFFLPWIILHSLLLYVIFQTKMFLLQVFCLHEFFSYNKCVKFLLLLIVILTTYLTYKNTVKTDEAMNKTLEISCFWCKNRLHNGKIVVLCLFFCFSRHPIIIP